MRSVRELVAVGIAGVALPLATLLGQNAGAATWTFYKLAGSGSGSEPGIDAGLDADGDQVVYVHGTFGIPTHNKAWRLDENDPDGKFDQITFSQPFNRLPGGGDADIAFRGDEMWFIDLWAGSNSIQYSPDKGVTWTLGTPFTTLPLTDRQWIALGPTVTNSTTGARETTVYAAYQTFQPGDGVWVSISHDNGLTWAKHVQVPVAGIPAHIVSDGGNTVAVAVVQGQGGRFNIARSTDGGETWTVSDATNGQADADGWAVGFTMNPEDANEMAVSYPIGRSSDGGPSAKTGVRVTHDGGATWSDLFRLDPNATNTGPMDWFPWIDWRGDKIAVAWYQSDAFVPARDPDNGTASTAWRIWVSESTDGGASFGLPESIGSGTVKKGAICTVGLSCSANRELGDFMQVAVAPDGSVWTTFVNLASANLPGAGIYVMKKAA